MAYWANTSSNSLAGKLIREGTPKVKVIVEDLLQGKTFHTTIDEQIIFSQLSDNVNAIWSLFLASGYLKVREHWLNQERGEEEYLLTLTNREADRRETVRSRTVGKGNSGIPDQKVRFCVLWEGSFDRKCALKTNESRCIELYTIWLCLFRIRKFC